jgi:hypothetical protein
MPASVPITAGASASDIQAALEDASGAGGGTVALKPGDYWLDRALVVPQNVTLEGAGAEQTYLHMNAPLDVPLKGLHNSGWDKVVGGLEDAGDYLDYQIEPVVGGTWSVWARYGADNADYGLKDMSGRTALQVDDGPPVPLTNLPNTGGWSTLSWARAGTIQISAGKHTLRWTNQKGGGINLDAFVFARSPDWKPGDLQAIKAAAGLIVVQAEDVSNSHTVQAQFPDAATAVVWLAGNRSCLRDLAVQGSPRTSVGVGVARLTEDSVVEDNHVQDVRVFGVEGVQSENSGVYVHLASRLVVQGCDLTARSPFYIEGMTESHLSHNMLRSETRWGGNAEAAIQCRTHALHCNIIDHNTIVGAAPGGGPTARRLLWASTGQGGSVSENYVGDNHGETVFGGVAGTDQNVGETILFETNMRVAYYGHPEAAGPADVTLPQAGPAWPPLEPSTDEPPQNEYFVYVVKGMGLGQCRRVVGRHDRTLLLDSPWDVPPDQNSLVLESLSFVHNIIVGNQLSDGMSGIQIWIGGYRNIVADNIIRNERREGIYLFGAMSTSDPAMPNRWNAGIGPLYYNSVVGNRIQGAEEGIKLGIGDNAAAVKGADWPRALGTVIRRNSIVESRTAGVDISGGTSDPTDSADISVEGTIVEFNFLRDAPTGYEAGARTVATLFRRNHAYFWNWPAGVVPKSFVTDGAREAVGNNNTVEGHAGNADPQITDELSTHSGR